MAPKLNLLENDELLIWMAETLEYLAEIRRLDDAQVELMKAAQSTGASSEGVLCAGEKDIIMVESGESAHAAGADPSMAGGAADGRPTMMEEALADAASVGFALAPATTYTATSAQAPSNATTPREQE